MLLDPEGLEPTTFYLQLDGSQTETGNPILPGAMSSINPLEVFLTRQVCIGKLT